MKRLDIAEIQLIADNIARIAPEGGREAVYRELLICLAPACDVGCVHSVACDTVNAEWERERAALGRKPQ